MGTRGSNGSAPGLTTSPRCTGAEQDAPGVRFALYKYEIERYGYCVLRKAIDPSTTCTQWLHAAVSNGDLEACQPDGLRSAGCVPEVLAPEVQSVLEEIVNKVALGFDGQSCECMPAGATVRGLVLIRSEAGCKPGDFSRDCDRCGCASPKGGSGLGVMVALQDTTGVLVRRRSHREGPPTAAEEVFLQTGDVVIWSDCLWHAHAAHEKQNHSIWGGVSGE